MKQEREELEQEALTYYQKAHKDLWFHATSGWMELDISVAQLRTLVLIANHGPIQIGQLARYMEIGSPTAGHLVEKLVKAGFVKRFEDAQDRRRSLAQLTAQGEALYARLFTGRQIMAACLQELSDEDLAAYLQGIRAISQALKNIISHSRGDRVHAW